MSRTWASKADRKQTKNTEQGLSQIQLNNMENNRVKGAMKHKEAGKQTSPKS